MFRLHEFVLFGAAATSRARACSQRWTWILVWFLYIHNHITRCLYLFPLQLSIVIYITPLSDGGRHWTPPPSQNSSCASGSDFFDNIFWWQFLSIHETNHKFFSQLLIFENNPWLKITPVKLFKTYFWPGKEKNLIIYV